MGELLDREFQRRLLSELQEIYPHRADVLRSWGAQSDNRLLVNLTYLHDHGLVELSSKAMMDGSIHMAFAKITAAGMDFIADDGGLSAILGVVTVKLHQDTIRDLLISKINAAEAPASTKEQVIAKIKALPADALGTLTQKALDAGLSNIHNLTGWLVNAMQP